MIFYPIILLGGLLYLSYLVCFVCVLIYSLFHKGKTRRLKPTVIVMGLLGLLPVMLIAFLTHHTLSQMSGNYAGSIGGGQDTFTLRPNGTFSQRFVTGTGKVYISEGSWRITKAGFGSFDFDKIILPIDRYGKPQKPVVSSFRGAETALLEPTDLSFPVDYDEDADISVTRTTP